MARLVPYLRPYYPKSYRNATGDNWQLRPRHVAIIRQSHVICVFTYSQLLIRAPPMHQPDQCPFLSTTQEPATAREGCCLVATNDILLPPYIGIVPKWVCWRPIRNRPRGFSQARALFYCSAKGWEMLNILFGIIFIIGGLSGDMVLVGTDSSGLLVLVGVVLVIWGISRVSR